MPKYYRPPSGRFSETNLVLQNSWDIRPSLEPCIRGLAAGQPADEGKGLQTVLGRTHPGAIVLLHATSRTNSEILDELLTEWKSRGIPSERSTSWPGLEQPAGKCKERSGLGYIRAAVESGGAVSFKPALQPLRKKEPFQICLLERLRLFMGRTEGSCSRAGRSVERFFLCNTAMDTFSTEGNNV